MKPLETYLTEIQQRLKTGHTVAETSHYGVLEDLLNTRLRPYNVHVLTHAKNTGSGIPDLALFDKSQTQGEKPAYGVVEVKPITADVTKIAQSNQVRGYAANHERVLVTNFYQFALVVSEPGGNIVINEPYQFADSADDFFKASPHQLAEKHEAAFAEYLYRLIQHRIRLSSPQEVAGILASYAREAKARLERPDADLSALEVVRQQLEQALGLKFQEKAGEEFFRSTLVQTLFYGIFSAWVLWHESHPDAKFDLWRDIRDLNLPAISEIFEELAKPGRLRPLDIEDLLIHTADALNRVERAGFFENFGRGDAVQYFYEPFLEAFDPELRRQLGVWYTPREVVQYMVARVDAALKDELHLADGLADPSVYVLDPCCGTGAYLVEVVNQIHARLKKRYGDALAGQMVNDAIQKRIFGFEILPAPFVVAHLQLGIQLSDLHAPLKFGQRAGVYLTNALTGWQPGKEEKQPLLFPELRKEREAANEVKRERPILVILGNPPYSGYAGTAIDEERELTNAYRTTIRAPRPQGQGLNDLYIRFFRMAERRIVENTGQGVISFISNYSWLDGLSHTGMRERYLDVFDKIIIDSLNGDKYRTGKVTPDGKPDPSIFSTDFNREGIQVGTAITLMIRKPVGAEVKDAPLNAAVQRPLVARPSSALDSFPDDTPAEIYYRDLWGTGKRAQLLEDVRQKTIEYMPLTPDVRLGYPLMPRKTGQNYLEWVKLPDLFPVSFPGVITSRDNALIDIDRNKLAKRMQLYYDEKIGIDELRKTIPDLVTSNNQAFDPIATRDRLVKKGYDENNLIRYCYRPFDVRWLYYETETNLLYRRSPDYFPHVRKGNIWLISSEKARRGRSQPQIIQSMGSRHLEEHGSFSFPLYLYNLPEREKQPGLLPGQNITERLPNLSEKAAAYLATIGADEKALFFHTLAVLHAPCYRDENAGALRQDWPRVPLPQNRDILMASAEIGQQVAALLDVETPVPGVTSGDIHPALESIAVLTAPGGQPDFALTARWGYAQRGTVMPGTGKIQDNGESVDVYLNETTYWQNIPKPVWEYTLGGYKVLKKWLSYRAILERDLKLEEVVEFTNIARRIAALLLLNDELDANYRAVTAS